MIVRVHTMHESNAYDLNSIMMVRVMFILATESINWTDKVAGRIST